MLAAVKPALAPVVPVRGLSVDPIPEGCFVLRTTDGEWLDRGSLRYWPEVREARACAKGYSQIHTLVRVHVYRCLGALPYWVETWLYGVRTIPIRVGREEA